MPNEATNAQPMTADHFKDVFREHPAGVALITADPGGDFAPAALTATSVISLNAAPPTIAFSLSEFSSSTPAVRAAETVVIHFLDADSVHLAKLGSTSGIDRFADTELWGRLETGEPYFKDAKYFIQGKIVGKMDVPGATVVAVEGQTIGGRAIEAEANSAPLVYHNRTWHHLGDHSALAQ